MTILNLNQMEYKERKAKPFVLAEGIYKGYRIWVVSYGTHPCCYIGFAEGNKFFGKCYDTLEFACHGGLTFSGYIPELSKDLWLLGWDYAHYLDHFEGIQDGYKWTTKELINQVKAVIDFNKLGDRK